MKSQNTKLRHHRAMLSQKLPALLKALPWYRRMGALKRLPWDNGPERLPAKTSTIHAKQLTI